MKDSIWDKAEKQFAEIKSKIASMFDCDDSENLNDFVFDYIHCETIMKNMKDSKNKMGE